MKKINPRDLDNEKYQPKQSKEKMRAGKKVKKMKKWKKD